MSGTSATTATADHLCRYRPGTANVSDDDVHQPRCPDYDLPGFATGQGGEHLVRRKGEGLGGGLVQVGRHLHAISDLAVDLDDHGDGVVDQLGRVGFGPWFQVDITTPSHLPELGAEVWR